jgi:hypothetical protein
MATVFLLCSPAGICSSMLCYVLNQSSECVNEETSEVFRPFINLFIDRIFSEDNYEKSDLTVNDRWNFSSQVLAGDRKKYTHDIRNNTSITYDQAQWAVDTFYDTDKNIFLFSHAHNLKEIQQYNIKNLKVIQALHGDSFLPYVHFWMGRTAVGYYRDENFKEIMNQPVERWIAKIKAQIDYWKSLGDDSIPTVTMHEWLDDDIEKLYKKINISQPDDIIAVKETIKFYKQQNFYNHTIIEDIKQYAITHAIEI